MVPLAPFCPTNPISPRSPIGPVSPRWPWWPLLPWRRAINEQACNNVPTRAAVPVCLTIQTFNTGSPLDEHLHLTPGVYHHGGELFNSLCKTTNWQTSESKRCILALEQSELTNLLASFSSFSNFARFALLTLVEKIGQGCELTKTSVFSLASEWNLELPAETLTLTPSSPGGPGGPSFPQRPISPLSPLAPSGPASPFSPWKEQHRSHKRKNKIRYDHNMSYYTLVYFDVITGNSSKDPGLFE